MGQDMASAQLLKGISVGTILWIKELADDDGRERYGLPSNCFQHPCVVVDLAASRKGFAQIYVITSKGDRNVNDVPLPRHVRSRYVPIHPKPTNVLLPGVQLHLAGSSKLRKDSYVNTEKVYKFPLAYLERYSRKQPVSDFCLDPASTRWLRAKAFGEPLLDAPIEQTITPTASTSTAPIYYSPVQRPLPYAAVPAALDSASIRWLKAKAFGEPLLDAPVEQTITPTASTSTVPIYYSPVQRPLPYVAVPAAQPRTYITFRNDELPHSSRSRSTTQTVVPIVGILILAATAAFLVFTLWL